MPFLAKLNIARAVTAILVISIVALVATAVSHEYCHGSSHNARGYYCEAVYANEDGYRALQ